MFFLRCAFFLSIVYVSIFSGVRSLRSPHTFEAAVASQTVGVTGAAVQRATDWCSERPAQCVRDAARLTALVQTASAEPVPGTEDADDEAQPAPMPVPDPRRRAARAMLTDAR